MRSASHFLTQWMPPKSSCLNASSLLKRVRSPAFPPCVRHRPTQTDRTFVVSPHRTKPDTLNGVRAMSSGPVRSVSVSVSGPPSAWHSGVSLQLLRAIDREPRDRRAGPEPTHGAPTGAGGEVLRPRGGGGSLGRWKAQQKVEGPGWSWKPWE